MVNYYFHMNQTLSATNVKVTVKIITQKFCPHIFSLFRTFALICAKSPVYFSIRTYSFYFTLNYKEEEFICVIKKKCLFEFACGVMGLRLHSYP